MRYALRYALGALAIAAWSIAASSIARCEDQPFLMLDTGGPQSSIRGVTFTSDGKYLVSAGWDKVVRVWDWRAGKTVRTIRGQAGLGEQGRISAMALSPNGRWLAVAASTVGRIRLYDFATGELRAVPKEQRTSVSSLAFSSDSKLLISGEGSKDPSAIIWDVEAGQAPHPPLRGHTGAISWVGFTPDGLRVLTASSDKTLRLWNVADGALIGQPMLVHGDGDVVAAISPQDGTIASADASGEIRLWDGKTGAQLRSDPFARQVGRIGSLSFSPDGRLLLATCIGGPCGYAQRVFDVASGKELVAYRQHTNTVFASAFSPDGQLVATGGGNDKEIDIWDPRTGDTKATLKGTGSSAFAVAFSADGRRFAWGASLKNNQRPLEMTLRLPSGNEPFGEPEQVTSQDGWVRALANVAPWSLRTGPDGNVDILQDGKVQKTIARFAKSYGFTPDGETVIAGFGSGVLAAYRRDGTWIGNFVGHEADVFALSVSPDGKYLVSGSSDQTVRLWDVTTRALLATLFYGTDGEWVMWTPEGFFTRSRKGGDRVGWQINHGFDKAADYITGEQVRDAFFRPDLVAAKIVGDPDGKVKKAAEEISIEEVIKSGLAPEVTILTPSPGSKAEDVSITVTAKISDKGGGIGRIAWRINSQEIQFDYGVSALNAQGEITRSFELAATENKIEVVVENTSGKVASLPAAISVNVDQRTLESKGLPDLYILALGVNNYDDAKHKLEFAVSDATELSTTLAAAGKDYYRHPPQVVMLPNDQVTAERVGAAFKELGGKIKANDVFLFFVAGHGQMIDGDYYFVPGNVSTLTDATITKQGFGPKLWRDWFVNIKAQKSVWIFDTCDAGAARRIFDRAGETPEAVAQQRMKAATGRAMFMASSDQESANEGYHGHGLLTYAILEGLALAGDAKDAMIKLTDLKDYVEINVPKYSREMKACQVQRQQEFCQRPVVPLDADNFALVPRYSAHLARLGTSDVAFSRTPTHVVVAAADLTETAIRGGNVKRQLPPGTTVTLIKIDGDWAYVAKDGVALGYIMRSQLLELN
jgi:WD40 repeat protein/uncharacterized caspase-like protein